MSKLYTVSIYLDINVVSCPGVWLCPKGKAFLKICLFGVSDLTKEVDPFFPLVFKERFHFQKVFKNINSVYELHDKLGRSIISLELLQCPIGSSGCVKLALFNALLSDILHPYTTCFSKPLHTSGLELLFTTCKVFPGIIAPKADVSTKVMVTDTIDGGRSLKMQGMISRFVTDDEKKRQQKVCHTKNNTNCRCFQDDPIDDLKPQRSVGAVESEEIPGFTPHGMQTSRSRRTERNVLERKETVNVRTAMGDLEDQSRASRVGREEGIASSNLRENGSRKYDYDRRGNIGPRTDRGDGGDYTSDVSRDEGVLSIGPGAAVRPATVREHHLSNNQNLFSKYDERPKVYNRNKHDTVLTPNDISEEHVLGRTNVDERRTPGESRQQKESEGKHIKKNMTSCEKFLLEHDFEEIRRTNDQLVRDKYFKCYKEQRTNGKAPSTNNRELGETSRDISAQLMNEEARGSVPQKDLKGKECGGCKCLKSYKKKLKAKKIAAKDLRPKGTFPLGDNDKHEYVSSKVGVERELAGGAIPPRSEYQEQYGNHRELPRRINSRSNVELYSKQLEKKNSDKSYSDQNYVIEEGGWKPRELQASNRGQSKELQEPSQVGSVRDGYRDMIPTIVPEMQGGRGGRTNKNDRNRASRRYEPNFDRTRMTRTIAKAQPEQQSLTPDNINRLDDRNMILSGKVEPRIDNLPAKPKYDHGRRNPEVRESSENEDETSGEECKCTLCKNYQETYKPRTHPCPWFRKTAGSTMKIRLSKSNIGPKKVIPSRRPTVTKTHKGASKKLRSDSEYPNECGFANCDTLDYDFIGYKKDIKSFFGHT